MMTRSKIALAAVMLLSGVSFAFADVAESKYGDTVPTPTFVMHEPSGLDAYAQQGISVRPFTHAERWQFDRQGASKW